MDAAGQVVVDVSLLLSSAPAPVAFPADRISLLQRHRDALARTARLWAGETHDGDDLFQDVCVFIIRHHSVPDCPERFLAWAKHVTRNFALHHFRRRRRSKEVPLATLSELGDCHGASHAEGASNEEEKRSLALRRCLAELAPAPKDLLIRCYLQGESSIAAGKRLGTSAVAIRQRLQRIRRALRNDLVSILAEELE